MKSFREHADETLNEKEFKDYFEEFTKLYQSISQKDINRFEAAEGMSKTKNVEIKKDRRFFMNKDSIAFEVRAPFYDEVEDENIDTSYIVTLSNKGKITGDWSGAGW